MKPRDALIVAAVILIAGFAAADAIRGRAEHTTSSPSTAEPQPTPTRLPGPQPQAEAPQGWPVGQIQGTLVFTDARDCRVRVVGLAGGVERPVARFEGNCELWVPPVTERVAYGLGPTSPEGFSPFRVVDLEHPQRDLGGIRALLGTAVIWRNDGQRVAWCGRRHTGFDLAVGGAARRLPRCPIAYTPDGRLAYAVGNRLVVGGGVVLQTDGDITYAVFLANGSIVVEVDGRRLEVYRPNGARQNRIDLPEELQGRNPIVAPDGCAVIFRQDQPPVGGIELIDLGCFEGTAPRFLQGRDAAWSPDGRWIAVAEPDVIVFYELVRGGAIATWPALAAQLAWRIR